MFVGPTLARLTKCRPGVKAVVKVSSYLTLPVALRSGECELALAENEAFEGEREFEVIPLPSFPIVFFGRSGHPLAGRAKVSPKEFFSFPVAAQTLPDWVVRWVMDLPRSESSPSDLFQLDIECNSHSVVNRMVAGSDAVSGAPLSIFYSLAPWKGFQSASTSIMLFFATWDS